MPLSMGVYGCVIYGCVMWLLSVGAHLFQDKIHILKWTLLCLNATIVKTESFEKEIVMLVEIENIGLFEKAEVEINGLCVIAGVNDTGKSTLGKIVYSVIQGLKRYESTVDDYKDDRITAVTDEVFFLVRRYSTNSIASKEQFNKIFLPPVFRKEIQDDPYMAITSRINVLESILAHEDPDKERFIGIAAQRLHHLLAILTKKESKIELIKKSISNAFNSEFEGQFCSKFTEKKSRVKISENNEAVVDIHFLNNKVTDLYINEELTFNDSLLIDTPIVIQLSKIIKQFSNRMSLGGENAYNVPLHWKDLNNRVIDSKYFYQNESDLGFESIIGNSIFYDEEAETFQYGRHVAEHRFDVRAINAASGIKSLSILNLLLNSGQISTRTLLVIDEPEVNLHPEWQVEYAKIISKLVSYGVTIIATTHSPYMIEAFKVYDDIHNINTTFYLTKKCHAGLSTMHNYTQSVGEIIDSLSLPLETLNNISLKGIFDDF